MESIVSDLRYAARKLLRAPVFTIVAVTTLALAIGATTAVYSIVDGVTGILVDSHQELVDRLDELLTDSVMRDQLGAKAQARSGEFSWTQSAEAMRNVLEAVQTREFVSGVV